MTRLGLIPFGTRVVVAPLPEGAAAVALDALGTTVVTVNAALGARARGYALRLALHALAAPRPEGVPFASVVAARAEWDTSGRA